MRPPAPAAPRRRLKNQDRSYSNHVTARVKIAPIRSFDSLERTTEGSFLPLPRLPKRRVMNLPLVSVDPQFSPAGGGPVDLQHAEHQSPRTGLERRADFDRLLRS